MDLEAFNEEIIENRNIYLVGEFNIDLMKTEIDTQTSLHLTYLYIITCPTRITTTSSTLIDNIELSNSLHFCKGFLVTSPQPFLSI